VFDVQLASEGIGGTGMLWRMCAILTRDFSPFRQTGIVSKCSHPTSDTGFVALSTLPEGVGKLHSD